MDVKKLKGICTKAKKVCKGNLRLPILDYAYLDEKSVKVTNLEITYKAFIETGLEHPICILLKDLDGLVSKLKEGEIELKVLPGSSFVFKEGSRTEKT